MDSPSPNEKVWLVTGCSHGSLGASIATHVYNVGHTIIATARDLDSLHYLPESPRVLKLHLDVTISESITTALNTAIEDFGRLDVVVNNAGYGSMCELEGFPEDEARKQIETLFWGPVHITKEAIRIFREVNPEGHGGTVLQISSMGGYLSYPGYSIYHAGKFALEGLSKAVDREMNPKWNIRVVIVSPGGVNTKFSQGIKYFPRHPAYDNKEAPMTALTEHINDPSTPSTWADPDKCAGVIFDAVMRQKEKPLPRRLNLGADTLPLMREDVGLYLKEMEDWEEETLKVMR